MQENRKIGSDRKKTVLALENAKTKDEHKQLLKELVSLKKTLIDKKRVSNSTNLDLQNLSAKLKKIGSSYKKDEIKTNKDYNNKHEKLIIIEEATIEKLIKNRQRESEVLTNDIRKIEKQIIKCESRLQVIGKIAYTIQEEETEKDDSNTTGFDENYFMPFEGKQIRKIWHNEEWYFSITDVIDLLTDSKNPPKYWSVLKSRENQLKSVVVRLSLDSYDGNSRMADCTNVEGLFRIIMSVPSPKAEPLKLWMASIGGKPNFDEAENKQFYTLVVGNSILDETTQKADTEAFMDWYKKHTTAHLYLAAYAAFPLQLTADLLYKIWQNFKHTEGSAQSEIPRIAVSDLLLSGLLHETSTEVFEYAPDLRKHLLQAAQQYFKERGRADILTDLATFMLDYLSTHYVAGVAYTEPIREAEEWNALAYLDPAEAHRRLAAALNPSAQKNYQTRQLRAALLVENLDTHAPIRALDAPTQSDFERILTFSKGMRYHIQGKASEAYQTLKALPEFGEAVENAENTEGVARLELPKAVIPQPKIEEKEAEKPQKQLWWCAFGDVPSTTIERDIDKLFELFDYKNFANLKMHFGKLSELIEFLTDDSDKLDIRNEVIFLIYYRSRTEPFDTKILQGTQLIRHYVIISDAPYPSTVEFGKNANDTLPNLIWIQSTSASESPFFVKSIGLFTQKLLEVLKNAEKPLKYTEVFSRVYTKVTQQTDTQHPKIQAFGQANLDDFFLNGMLKTPNTEGSLLPKMTVGFRNTVAEYIKTIFLVQFKKEGESLFFDLIDTQDNTDYLIQFDGKQNIYTLETAVRNTLTCPPCKGHNRSNLITFFNNIDRVANWQFTLGLNGNPNADVDHEAVKVRFVNLGLDRTQAIEMDWRQPILLETHKNGETYFSLSVKNEGQQTLYVSMVYLDKDFSVTNDFLPFQQLKPNEEGHLGFDNHRDIPLYISQEYLAQGKTSITDYIKIFISTNPLNTDSLNREPLSIKTENTRDLVERSSYQTGNWSQHNIAVKTVVVTLKLKATGFVKKFMVEKGFGLIQQDDGGKDLVFHFSEVVNMPQNEQGQFGDITGMRVFYEYKQGEKGLEAIVIELHGFAKGHDEEDMD